MHTEFQQLYSELCGPSALNLEYILDKLRDKGDFSDDLLSAMEERVVVKHWVCLCRLIWIVCYFPDRKFTPFLCTLLDNHQVYHPRHDYIMEAVVDALIAIGDERATAALTRIIDFHVQGDDNFHLNRKVIGALAKIGTKESIKAIRTSLQSPYEIIREEAADSLDRMRKHLE